MGTMINAKCTQCDFESGTIFFGTGMRTRTPKMPVIEIATGKFDVIEGLDQEAYRYYNQPDMYEGRQNDDFIQDADIYLSPENNLCPHCGVYAMRFDAVGNWD